MMCNNCPLAGTPAEGSCPGHRYCDLLNPGHPHHDPRYARILMVKAGLAEREPIPETPASVGGWSAPTHPYVPPRPPVSPVDEDAEADARRVALDVLVNQCEHRGCRTGCGKAQCGAGLGDMDGGAVASLTRCRACEHGGGRLATPESAAFPAWVCCGGGVSLDP